jgi:ABC-type uncharacterized transport system permease subunit
VQIIIYSLRLQFVTNLLGKLVGFVVQWAASLIGLKRVEDEDEDEHVH